MVRSLYTAASGMIGQQQHIDTISNNLANINTAGFKRNRTEFEDLLYQNQRHAVTPATEETLIPVGVQIGSGTRLASTAKLFEQGSLQQTGVVSDLAIEGEGFFRVQQFDGSFAYTRNGSFKIDATGELVTARGYRLLPATVLPEDFVHDSLAIGQSGEISVRIANEPDPIVVGQLQLFRFVNPAGLAAVGENLFQETPASGAAIGNRPAVAGNGIVAQGFVEQSNVQAITELVNMIVAQRAYELNSRAVQTTDAMLGIAVSLKR